MSYNIILDTDSYKHSHFAQYPSGTSEVNSYIESRGGEYGQTVFFGLQAWLKKALAKPVTLDQVVEAAEICEAHGVPFNRDGWEYIVREHGGRLPLEIEAAPEGTVMPVSNVMVQVRNTDPRCWWLTSFIETAMLRAIWYPTTVATVSWHLRGVIGRYLDETADPGALEGPALYAAWTSAARGVSSEESAGIGGLAHLISFQGTDTMAALLQGRRYYGVRHGGLFLSRRASTATMTSWLRSGETDAYRNMLEKFGSDGGIVSIVSDSYDIFQRPAKTSLAAS